MMRGSGASLTMISIKTQHQVGEPKLEVMGTGIETSDHHKVQYLGAFFPKVPSENKLIDAKTAVVKIDENFGFLGRYIQNEVKKSVGRCFSTAETAESPQLKVDFVSNILKQKAKTLFCVAKKVPLLLEQKVNEASDELSRSGTLVP